MYYSSQFYRNIFLCVSLLCSNGMVADVESADVLEEHIDEYHVQENQQNMQIIEEIIRCQFFEILHYLDLFYEAEKMPLVLDTFFATYTVTPYTRIRDFVGSRPYISLMRLAVHEARLGGKESQFALIREMLKRGGDPFIVEEGERFSLADENALACIHLGYPKKVGFNEGIYDYGNACEQVKQKAENRYRELCSNAKTIQTIFEEFAQEENQ